MASYPGTPSKYPATPAKYPATLSKYPSTTEATYPASAPPDPSQVLGSALKGWLRADSSSNTIVSGAFSAIANLADTSVFTGLSQGTAARRPNQSTCRGRQCTHHLSSTQHWMNVAAFSAAIAQPWVLYAVQRSQSTGTTTLIARAGNSAFLQTAGAAWPRDIVASAGTSRTASAQLVEDEVCSIEVLANGASSVVRKNGSVIITGLTLGANSFDGMWLGSSATPSAYITGQECEVILVNRALTAGERTQLETWFQYQWSHLDTQKLWWPLGDSLTAGDNGNNWRQLLSAAYSNRKFSNRWLCATGTVKNYTWWDDKMNGVSGNTLADIATSIAANTGVGNTCNAPIVSTIMGTNDCRNNGAIYVPGFGIGTTQQAYADNLTAIDTNITAATGTRPLILVTTIPDCNSSQVTARLNIADFNANLPTTWTALEGAGLRLVRWDLRAALGDWSAAYYGADNFHPNGTGAVVVEAAIEVPLTTAAAAA